MAQKKRQLNIISENTGTSENQNVNGAVLNRGISNQDRSLAFIKDDLHELHSRVKRDTLTRLSNNTRSERELMERPHTARLSEFNKQEN